jgi:hypothetical protein
LLERLKQVSEGEIYNYPERQYSKVMSEIGEAEEGPPSASSFSLRVISPLCGSLTDEIEDEEIDDENAEREYEQEEEEEEEDEEEDELGQYNVEYVEVRSLPMPLLSSAL